MQLLKSFWSILVIGCPGQPCEASSTRVLRQILGQEWKRPLLVAVCLGLLGCSPSPVDPSRDIQGPSNGLGSAVYTHEPPGFTRVTELHFDHHGELGWNDLSDNPRFEIVRAAEFNPEESSLAGVSSPPDTNDGWIGVAKFFPSLGPGSAPINYNMSSNHAVNALRYDEFFWAHWFQASRNHYITSTGVNKIGFVELGEITEPHGSSAIYWALTGGEKADSFAYAVFTQGTADEGKRYTCSGGRIIKAGQWHKMEHYARLNSVAANGEAIPDGVFRVWVDDKLCLDVSDVRFRGTGAKNVEPDEVFSRIKWNPTYSSPSPPDTMYQFMSHLYTSGR